MKIFSLYLPQFHEIPENNEWWGDGFTEWINVKKAQPLFKGHLQPKHPLNNNYYDLMSKKTVEWQTSLMHKYGIYGMIYYHYYFCGRMLLEKPAENLLRWKEIDQPFFFCWANHTWNRSWKGSKEVLLEQTYGDETDWKRHFDYLLPFFKDDRYEKKNNKPLFMIYDCSFEEKKKMVSCFDKWCIENGFDGIYIIEECMAVENGKYKKFVEEKSGSTQSFYLTEPQVGRRLYLNSKTKISDLIIRTKKKLNQKGIIKWLQKYDANKIYKELIKNEPQSDNIIHGFFFEWDNTPRHSNRGFIITPVQKEIFFAYMDHIKNSEYAILNAWNEWAEGMMVEPTEELGYKYLEWIKEWTDKNV
ncbi:MAG: glycoside hydrolase family 99-like domain-containing protein [Lachnospiraceae bacterium]